MTNTIIVGAQWGDEGKGKIVDWLSENAQVIVRFQGGHNAGHTIVVKGQTFKLSLLPSGILRQDKLCVIGNGVVVDPWVLLDEIEKIRSTGVKITSDNLRIAENATIILPLHQELDLIREERKGKDKIGTTGRGIGPAYEDKVARRALHFTDLSTPTLIQKKLHTMLDHHNALRKGLGVDSVDFDELYQKILQILPKILPFVDVSWRLLDQASEEKKSILFEGAQGCLLDIDHGTYPYVTSSNTTCAQAALGSGFPFKKIDHILGVCKAYTTRVGSGPFPTELFDNVGKYMSEKGHEVGTVTGRQRRCGWLDAVLVKQMVKINGFTGLVLTKADVLGGLDHIKICTAYKLNGETIDYFPANADHQEQLEPIYETLPGWDEDISQIRDGAQLPKQVLDFVSKVEKIVGIPIVILSTSPDRDDTILLKKL